MGLLCPIVLILPSAVDRLRKQFPVRFPIAAQFVSDDFSGFIAVTPQQALEEALYHCPIAPRLKIYVNHFTTPINCLPKVMLSTTDRMVRHTGEYFINVKRIPITPVAQIKAIVKPDDITDDI